jgi:hypothetical protein
MGHLKGRRKNDESQVIVDPSQSALAGWDSVEQVSRKAN